jgi:hypothetical protein
LRRTGFGGVAVRRSGIRISAGALPAGTKNIAASHRAWFVMILAIPDEWRCYSQVVANSRKNP